MISKCTSIIVMLTATTMLSAQSKGFVGRAERTISGTIKSVGSFPAVDGSVGVHIDLRTADGLVEVSVAPAAFIGQNNFWFFADEAIVVTVSEDPAGGGAVWAKTIQKGSQVLPLRGDTGLPKWSPASDGVDGCGVNHLPLQRTTVH